MLALYKILQQFPERVRHASARWWGSIGCRVSFFVSSALIMVAVMGGAFFFWQTKKTLEENVRGRALFIARGIAAQMNNDIIKGNRNAIYKKITSMFIANRDTSSANDLLFILVYSHTCKLLIGSTANEVFSGSGSHFHTIFPGENTARADVPLNCEDTQLNEPFFRINKAKTYDLTYPVYIRNEKKGYVRIGLSGQKLEEQLAEIIKKGMVVLFVVLLIGIAFSQIIAIGITKPILQLSDAVEKFSFQNWSSPLPISGRGEISTLAQAFNRMALALKQRELSLSRGNKDLFILHTAGLDLMESLNLDTLLSKITARAEDLVRADTASVAVVNPSDRMLKYMRVSGGKARELGEMDMPLEAGGIYNWFACYGTPLLITEAQTDFRLDGALMKSMGIRSIISIPFWSSNSMIGILTAVNKKGCDCFDKQDLRLFTVFSNLAGAALQNASLYTDLTDKIKELRNAQEQLVHSTKMAAIGELAANVAHEVNNPLTSVLGYTTHLLKTRDAPEPAKRMLRMMEQETLRVRKIIRNLLDFSREKASSMKPDDLRLPLRETIALSAEAAESAAIKINKEYQEVPAIVNMNAGEIKQVFMNIINNAFQAMPHGGVLSIRLIAGDADEAVVEFADTGTGISGKNIKKIFDPFFSTKENNDRTGLGLFISYRIVQNHGGRIEVESESLKGTRFKVFLPLYEKA
jgi:signal transduction histidine kinase/HAMP domain-containing protein